MKPVSQIKLGIIGSGQVTIQRHIPSVRFLADPEVAIVAVADSKPGVAEAVARNNEIPSYFTDYRDLLASDTINTVAICTPTFTHAEIAIVALQAGKHVYLEKPVTQNEAEMKAIMQVAAESELVLVAGSNGLLQCQMQVMKQLIASKVLGEVYSISIERVAARATGDRQRQTMGEDGVILENASHGVEWALWFLGDPKPVTVTAIGYYKYENLSRQQRDPREVEDSLLALIQFENGSSFMYKVLRSAVTPTVYQMNIYGDQGSIKYDVHKCYKEKSDECLWFYQQNSDGVVVESKPLIPYGRNHAAMYRHFFECIRAGKPSPISDGRRALTVMKILDALHCSVQQNGSQIKLD